MMQVDFNFTPPLVTVISNPIEQNALVLLGRIEVAVNQRPTFVIAPSIDGSWISTAPVLDAALLFRKRRTRPPIFRHNRWLEVIGNPNHEVNIAAGDRSGKPLPRVGRQPSPVRKLRRLTNRRVWLLHKEPSICIAAPGQFPFALACRSSSALRGPLAWSPRALSSSATLAILWSALMYPTMK